ncbi:MAG: hypothetical protein QW802_04750 [Candidatus Altiarchaeota archaeon]
MWLVTTLTFAIIVTLLWFKNRKYKLDFLALMLWGATIMIFTDHILGYEGGDFIEIETEGLITNAGMLGILMLLPLIIIWAILLYIEGKKSKMLL